MRPASNHAGWVVERHDGPKVGWVAIDGPFVSMQHARNALCEIERTPGAEYRVYMSVTLPERPPIYDFSTVAIAFAQYGRLMSRLFAMGRAQE